MEQIEKACNSQLARELEVALPIELSREEQVRIVRAYCSSQFVSRGMCADFNIHDTGSGNPHAHILLTMRPIDEKGAWLPKSKKEYVLDENGEKIRLPSGRYKTRKVDLVDWNNRENAEVWRRAWADLANEYLEKNNRPERIDHRSYERQGIDQIPTVHIGVAASQMEKKGIATERGELNRSIKAANRLLRDIKAQIGKLKELVWMHMRTVISYVSRYEDHFRAVMEQKLRLSSEAAIRGHKKRLAQAEKRLGELDRLFIRIYEDNVAGRITDEKFSMMSKTYEDEQAQLKAEIQTLQQEIEVQERQIENLEQFIQRVRKYEDLDELTPYALRELVKAIYIEAPDKSSGKRHQGIRISYDLVGFIPVEELLKQETA